MIDAMFDERGHVVPEILASRSDPWETWGEDEVTAHLRDCRHCAAVYAEFVRTRARFALDPTADMPPDDLLAIAKAIPITRAPARVPARLPSRRRRRLEPALAALAAGLVVTFLWTRPWERHATEPNLTLRQTIEARIRTDSKALLYDANLMPLDSETRGTGDAADGALDLVPLQQSYADNPASPGAAYWLIAALLATGLGRDADPVLAAAIERFPRDPRFHNLAAIRAYRESKLPAAEAALNAGLAIEPRPELLFNLAKVVDEQGRVAESQQLYAKILQDFPHSAVASLARTRIARPDSKRAS